MSNFEDLLTRVRNATGPDREWDAEIASALGFPIEWKQANYTMETYPVITWSDTREPCPQFTASIDAALALVERVLPGWHGALTWLPDHGPNDASFACEIGPMDWSGDGPPDNIIGHGDSMPLAILAALLTALIAKEGAK